MRSTIRLLAVTLIATGVGGLTAAAPAAASPLTGIQQVVAGTAHSCARVAGGEVRCWGQDVEGEAGDGSANFNQPLPVAVRNPANTANLTGVVEVAATEFTTCARLSQPAGQVRCWGSDFYGLLGNGGTVDTNSALPVAVLAVSGSGNLTGVTQLSGGTAHFCARLNTGRAVCWGSNVYRQLGNASSADRSARPVYVKPPSGVSGPALTHVAEVSAGGQHSCARLSAPGGQVRCWGRNDFGNLGDGTTATERRRPVAVRAVSGAGNLTGVVGLSLGGDHSCARLGSNQVRCWGNGTTGELGSGTTPMRRSRPIAVRAIAGAGNLTGVTQLDARVDGTCARRNNGSVVCWGRGSGYTNGNGSTADQTRPVLVPSTGVVSQVSSGWFHGCARRTDGTAVCWGTGYIGQLGTGGTDNAPTPVVVQG